MKNIHLTLAGNSFLTKKSDNSKEYVSNRGWENWSDCNAVFSAYIKITEKADFKLSLKFSPAKNDCIIRCTIGAETKNATVSINDTYAYFGNWSVNSVGYIKMDFSGVSCGTEFPMANEIIIEADNDEIFCGYVKKDDVQNYYWTRRGPSVHCGYDIKSLGNGEDFEWFYNEVTVPCDMSPVGTYAMAIGFTGGYFGIQVNSENERRILFSIWSPFQTDNPDEIPEDKKVRLIDKHKNMYTCEFGGEGSGGQSYMIYNWHSGETYKFLMRIHPTENEVNKTTYTAYFCFPESGKWELLASFVRPDTNSYIEHPHSFLENFDDENGFLYRCAVFSNQWAITKNGTWYAPEDIVFTADATARAGNREDYSGGIINGSFYLENGGFFNHKTEIYSKFKIDRSNSVKPNIDISEL